MAAPQVMINERERVGPPLAGGQAGETAALVQERRPAAVAALAAGGIAGPILFTTLVIAQGLLQPDYSHLALPISALAAWPAGWVQNLNFVAFGLLMTAYAIGLHVGVRPARAGVIGPALLVLSAVGLVVAGSLPWSRADGGFVVPRDTSRAPSWRSSALAAGSA